MDWEIYLDDENEWRWKKASIDGNVFEVSSRGFEDRMDCLEDARKHGYLGG